ncbi:MAG: hypothetical protein AB7N71_09590 [Phycisphaerae bacterium]
MAWLGSELNDRDCEQARRMIRQYGEWLRANEPSQSLQEDLVCHRLRSLLSELLFAVDERDRAAARRVMVSIPPVAEKLAYLWVERGAR